MKYLLYIIFVCVQIVSIRGYSQVNKAHVWGNASGHLDSNQKIVDVFAGSGWTAVIQEDGSHVIWGNDFNMNISYDLHGEIKSFADDYVVLNDGSLIKILNSLNSYKDTYKDDIVKVEGSDYYTITLDKYGDVQVLIDEGHSNPVFDGSYASSLNGVRDVSIGYSHALAISSTGKVLAWGTNEDGETMVPNISETVIQVEAGYYFSVALTKSGLVQVWGADGDGLTQVPNGLEGVKMISAGGSHIVALKDDGTIVTWGSNRFGQLDVPDTLKNVVKIAAGSSHTIALTEQGGVWFGGSMILV